MPSRRKAVRVGLRQKYRYSPRVSRYLRRRLSNATRLKRAASSRGVDEPPRERVKGRL